MKLHYSLEVHEKTTARIQKCLAKPRIVVIKLVLKYIIQLNYYFIF